MTDPRPTVTMRQRAVAVGLPAARGVLAAVAASAAWSAFALPEPHWAALSAVMVTRAQPGSTTQAAIDRLVGTLAGAAIGCAAALGRHTGLPDALLLALALLPAGALAAWRDAYRTAPVAVIILLAAHAPEHSPLAAAGLRLAAISLGVGCAMALSWLIAPVPSHRRARAMATEITAAVATALDAAARGDGPASLKALAAARQAVRTLAVVGTTARWERWLRRGSATPPTVAEAARRLFSSAGFAVRLLLSSRGNPLIDRRAVVGAVAALGEGEAEVSAVHADSAADPVQRREAEALAYVLSQVNGDAAALARLLEARP